jgi:hypothetical protein
MTNGSANLDAITAMAENIMEVLGRAEQLIDGPLGQHDQRRAEIEMIRQDVIAALNLPESIRGTPAGDKMLLRLLRGKLLAASHIAFGASETHC